MTIVDPALQDAIIDHVFPRLKLPDLLNCRAVHSRFKLWADTPTLYPDPTVFAMKRAYENFIAAQIAYDNARKACMPEEEVGKLFEIKQHAHHEWLRVPIVVAFEKMMHVLGGKAAFTELPEMKPDDVLDPITFTAPLMRGSLPNGTLFTVVSYQLFPIDRINESLNHHNSEHQRITRLAADAQDPVSRETKRYLLVGELDKEKRFCQAVRTKVEQKKLRVTTSPSTLWDYYRGLS
jgi:hypothetical protein